MSANFLQANSNTAFWSGSVKYAAFNAPDVSRALEVVKFVGGV